MLGIGHELPRLSALRRVATLVAQDSAPEAVFRAVTEEVARVVGSEAAGMLRFEPDGTATLIAQSDTPWDPPPLGTRFTLEGENVVTAVLKTGQTARQDDWTNASGAVALMARTLGVRSSVATPIIVEGRPWGAMIAVSSRDEPLPASTESRIGDFTELIATAIASMAGREQRARLAAEQAALRRVATLVAKETSPTGVFDAVVEEVAELLGAAQVGLMRAEPGDAVTIVAYRGQTPGLMHAGMRVPLDGRSTTAEVLRTGRSARLNIIDEGSGTIRQLASRSSANATVGAPITVQNETWGVITASWREQELAPADADARLTQFAELVGTAISNADSRAQLAASRARVLTAGDQARRQVVRDIHDGAQQRLVHTIITLKLALRALRTDADRTEALLTDALAHAEQSNAELRELAHGILPAVLTRGGLNAGVDALVSRLDLPVDMDVTRTRLPPDVEASAYFIIAEGLTNVVKHAQAAKARVAATVGDGTLCIEVRDDGIGRADPEGPGLLGIGDRVAAFGGRLRIDSPLDGGTVLMAELPLPG